MNRDWRRGFLVLAGLAVTFAWGCNIFLNACTNVTCDAGEVCVNGDCVPAPECDSDADCGAGQVCANGECVECQTDADCDAGQVCDEGSNTCVECEGSADCDDDNACTADSCAGFACANTPILCATAATCPAGCNVFCLNGVCSD